MKLIWHKQLMPGPGSARAAPQSSDLHEAASSEVKQPSGQSQKKQHLRSRLLLFFPSSFLLLSLTLLLSFTHSAKFKNLKSLLPATEREGGRRRARLKKKNDILKPYAYLTKKVGGETQNLHILLATSFVNACLTSSQQGSNDKMVAKITDRYFKICFFHKMLLC